MNWSDWIAIVAAVISAGSLVVAMVSFRRAGTAERRSLADAKTQAFLAFRSRFLTIKHDLPPRWDDDTWLPERNTDEWRRLETYWQNAFDEWFVPMRLNKEHLQDVWTLFFESAVRSGLSHRALRYVAWCLCSSGEFGEHNEAYRLLLDQLWGKAIDADFKSFEGDVGRPQT